MLDRFRTDAGGTFQGLLQSARRELAHHCLLGSSPELNETAYPLGNEGRRAARRAARAHPRRAGGHPDRGRTLPCAPGRAHGAVALRCADLERTIGGLA